MELIIVESPTKARTLTRFLSSKYRIESSMGHIRDLEKKKMGIDIENDFEPTYIVPEKSKKTVSKLKALVKKADKIILAPDEDREGEAIAWHLAEALNMDIKKTERIVFHEITKTAILKALQNSRQVDMQLVDAQQARRVLDRLVGFELSPFLWKKIAYGLSAGRVQSVALRFVIEKEREIKAFKPEEYWSIVGIFNTKDKEKIEANLSKIKGKAANKMAVKTKKDSDKILKELENAQYSVLNVEQKDKKKKAPAPLTTSTLQISANRMLGFSSKQTMMIAQQLYEGLDLGGESGGLITYMRTDSLNLSSKFLGDAKDYLNKNLGKNYSLEKPRVFRKKLKGAQEAHEAIRPTEVMRTPHSLQGKLNPQQYKLYNLIWQRSIATQMPDAVVGATVVDIEVKKTDYQFRANGQVLKFDGYLKIYPEKSKELQLPKIQRGDILKKDKITGEQHFTQPPTRYSDASLVKVLEKHGIGRPSTYAPTISTIEARNYVKRDEQKKLEPTEIAFIVIDLLINHFPDIVNYEFTADMENKLDSIAKGKYKWQEIIKKFYTPFHDNLLKKEKEVSKKDIMPEEKSNEKCDKCGAEMVVKTGRYGKFLSCSAFPDCKNIKSLDGDKPKEDDEKTKILKDKYRNEVCDKCDSTMVIKNGKFGPFLACSAYPKCKNIKNIEENNPSTGIKCPKCGKGEIVARRSKRGVFYACNEYPKCKNAYFGKPTGEKCPECQSLLVEAKNKIIKCSAKDCKYTK